MGSEGLAKIIGTKKGEKISRPQVIKRLWAYLKDKNLQDPENKQFFTPDSTMSPILIVVWQFAFPNTFHFPFFRDCWRFIRQLRTAFVFIPDSTIFVKSRPSFRNIGEGTVGW